jgi:hypothetical protein
MTKVTISIDDANPAIVEAFGEGSLNNIAADMGYMEEVRIPEDELPAKVEVPLTELELDFPGLPEGTTTRMDYPEGTVFTKANPQTKAEFVAERILENKIIPALLERYEKASRATADAQIKEGIDQAKQMLKSVANIEVVE